MKLVKQLSCLNHRCLNTLLGASLKTMSSYAVLFPGQGSQYIGMTRGQESLAGTREIFHTAHSVLGYDLQRICLQGPQSVLDETVHCQPAVVAGSLIGLKQLEHDSPQVLSGCQATAGLSVGEITALIFAGSLTLEQGLQLIKVRAEAMQEACEAIEGSMASLLNIDEDIVRQLCMEANKTLSSDTNVCIAIYMFPKATVISGTTKGVQFVKDRAGMHGAVVKSVPVAGAFHSPLMNLAVPKLQKFLDSIDMMLPRIPVYSNVTSRPYSTVEEIKKCLADQVTKPVLWEASIRNMLAHKPGGNPSITFVEVGPGKQLKAMLKRIDRTSFLACHTVSI